MLVAQSCLTVRNPMDHSPPGSSGHRILWARILEWVAIPFSRGSYRPRNRIQVSCIFGVFLTVWATREAPWIPQEPKEKGGVSHEGLWPQSARFHPALLTTVATSFTGHYPLQANWFPLNYQAQLFSLSRHLLLIRTPTEGIPTQRCWVPLVLSTVPQPTLHRVTATAG